jgi:hypothetical protein
MATAGTVARHMYTLYKEMIDDAFGDDGCDATLSANTGYPVQAHHCISCSVMADHEGGDMARLAEEAGYDINNGNNGIALPAYFGHMRKESKQRHRGGHWDEYYKNVKKTLDPIYVKHKDAKPCTDPVARKNILGDLQAAENKIKGKLVNRTWWLYDWSEQLYDGDYRDEGAGNMKSARAREGSSSSGLQWLSDYAGPQVKRRHEIKSGNKSMLRRWYTKYGYPVPGGLTS